MFSIRILSWVVSTAFLLPVVQLQHQQAYPDSSEHRFGEATPLPFVFHYLVQGGGLSWICCSVPPSPECIKFQRAKDCPYCGPCLPPGPGQNNQGSGLKSRGYFKGRAACDGNCVFEASEAPKVSGGGDEAAGSIEQQRPQRDPKPNSPIRPPNRPQWEGPPLPPRNVVPRPPPVPPRPGGGK